MIPRSQHFGDPAPFPFKRSGIMRIFEEAAFKAFLLSAGRRAHYPGEQPNASVEQDESRRLAARKHIVPDRDRDNGPGLEQALVNAFEAPAQDRHARASRKLAHLRLGQRLAARRHRQQGCLGRRRQDMVDGPSEDVGAHHHAGTAASRRIVDRAMPVGGEIADLHRFQRPQTFSQSAPGEAVPERTREHFRVERQDPGRPAHCLGRTMKSSCWIVAGRVGARRT